MAVQRTLCIAKPDSVEKGVQGAIFQRLQEEGFKIVAMRQLQMSRAVAEGFYAVHEDRPFFDELCALRWRRGQAPNRCDRESPDSPEKRAILLSRRSPASRHRWTDG